jgi:aminobenzoyl-glutamate transport protein
MDKSGFLDTVFFLLTKRMPKIAVTFIFSLICVISSITGDLSFIVFIPLAALLFKYGKRNPEVGIILAFASIGLGTGLNIFISSTDSSLITMTENAARLVTTGYQINTFCYLFIMIAATLIGCGLITYITEKIIAPKMGKYEEPDEVITDKEKLTKKEWRGLIYAFTGAAIYIIIFIYNIIPYAPLGGNLLDYSQSRYIDMLFGNESFFNSGFVFVITFLFFLCGLLYAYGTKLINNHRDICNFLSHSLDEIGKVIILIFFASMFISLLKYTNIGSLITGTLTNILPSLNFSGIPLIIIVLLISAITTIFQPSFVSRWNIMSATVVPQMMTSGFTPEFSQLVFTAGSSITYALTPVMAYFVIYISYMEKYDKDGVSVIKCIKYIIPYAIALLLMWIVLLSLWYLVGIPLGISTMPTL